MALTQGLAPWSARIANFKRVIGRPSYITSQDGWPFGYWFMGHDHLPHKRGNVGSHDEHDGCHRQADPDEPDTHE